MTKLHYLALVAALLDMHGVGLAKDEPINISTITDASEPASVEMIKLFRQEIGEHDTLFKLVGNDEASAGPPALARTAKTDFFGKTSILLTR